MLTTSPTRAFMHTHACQIGFPLNQCASGELITRTGEEDATFVQMIAFFHGWGHNPTVWREHRERIASEFREEKFVEATLLGHSGIALDRSPLTLRRVAEDIETRFHLSDKGCLNVVVAHSLGAVVAATGIRACGWCPDLVVFFSPVFRLPSEPLWRTQFLYLLARSGLASIGIRALARLTGIGRSADLSELRSTIGLFLRGCTAGGVGPVLEYVSLFRHEHYRMDMRDVRAHCVLVLPQHDRICGSSDDGSLAGMFDMDRTRVVRPVGGHSRFITMAADLVGFVRSARSVAG